MPPVLVPVITSAIVAATGATAVTAGITLAANVIAYAVVAGASIGVSFLLQEKEKKQQADPGQVQVKQAIPARRRCYGIVKLGGTMFMVETFQGVLLQGLIHCEGPIHSYREWWLNDQNSGIAAGSLGGPNLTGTPWGAYVTVESRTGQVPELPATILTGYLAAWTADHRLDGLANSVLVANPVGEKYFSQYYPTGVPQLRVVIWSSLVYDPRTGLTGFSRNPALCIRDYLTNPDGFGLPTSRINEASFSAYADICDQLVPLKAGGTEPRYQCGATYDLTDEPRDVLKRLCDTCDAEIIPLPDGTIGIRGGVWEDPTVTITDADILSYELEQGSDKLSAFNRLKLSYQSPLHDYQPVETEAWEDLESQADVGVLDSDLQLAWVQSHGQARRLGKIVMRKANPRWKLTLSTNLAGLNALGERVVHVTIPEVGINESFRVTGFEISGDLLGCRITLASFDVSAYAWDAATEEGTPPPIPADTVMPIIVPVPTSVALETITTSVGTGGTLRRVRMTVATPASTQWTLIGRYRRVGDAAWLRMLKDELGNDYAAISDALADGVKYEFQAALAGWGGHDSTNISTWSPVPALRPPGEAMPANTVGLWPFNWAAPNQFADHSGNGNNFVATNGGTIVVDGTRGSVYKQTTTGQRLSTSIPIGDGSYTIAVWMKPDSHTGNKTIAGAAANSRWQFVLAGASLRGLHNATQYASYTMPDTNWHHVALAYDAVALTMTLYVDGVQVAQGTNVPVAAAAANFQLGAINAVGASTTAFLGSLDDAVLATRALTAAEIGVLMNWKASEPV